MKLRDKKETLQKPKKAGLTAVDIFSGGGALTLGLKRAGFNVIGAVEVEPHAFSTYKANHPDVQAFKQDIRTIKGESLLKLSSSGRIDLLAGCPPCQGFSNLTTKYKRPDPRNELINEMGRLIKEIKPEAVMMENVPGLAKKGKDLFDDLLKLMLSLGYIFEYKILQVADYGVPQSRRRLVLLAGKGFPIDFPSPTHSRVESKNRKQWITVGSVIKDMPEPITLNESRKRGGPQGFNWHIVRNMSPENQKRLLKTKPGKSRTSIPNHLRPKCHKNLNSGFTNVYGRMSWDNVSPTITGGCTTLSKGRFGHPEKNRTISVREAALLQTIPIDYIIDTPYMDYACDIIGNALPCDFSEALALKVRKVLVNQYGTFSKTN